MNFSKLFVDSPEQSRSVDQQVATKAGWQGTSIILPSTHGSLKHVWLLSVYLSCSELFLNRGVSPKALGVAGFKMLCVRQEVFWVPMSPRYLGT